MQRKPEDAWPPPQQIQSVDHAVRVSNTTDSPILLRSGEQLCQVRHILPVDASVSTSSPYTCSAASPSPATCKPFSSRVILDPDGCLDQDTREKFKALNLEFGPSLLARSILGLRWNGDHHATPVSGVTKHRNGMERNGIYRNKSEYTGTRKNDAGMDKNGNGIYRNEPE